MGLIKKNYTIGAPVDRVWSALVEPKMIDGWGGGPSKMSAREGAAFSLWAGDIWGKNTEVDPQKKIVQEWHCTDFPDVTEVIFELTKDGGSTKIVLKHSGVPASGQKKISEGWDDEYIGPIKNLLEKKH